MPAKSSNPTKTSPEKQVIAILFPALDRVIKMSALNEEEKCIAMIDDLERMVNEYDDCFTKPKEKIFEILEKWRKKLSEKYEYKLECDIQQNHFSVKKLTGEDAQFNEEHRAFNRWKDDMRLKADRQNRRLSEIMSEELAQLQEKKEEIKEETQATKAIPEEGDEEWIEWKKSQKAWFEHMNGLMRFEVRDEYKKQKLNNEVNKEIVIQKVINSLWEDSEDFLHNIGVKRLFPDHRMKKMMRQKIDYWIEDSIGKSKSEVTQTARSDDRAKRAKLMNREGYKAKEIAANMNLDVTTVRGYLRQKGRISV